MDNLARGHIHIPVLLANQSLFHCTPQQLKEVLGNSFKVFAWMGFSWVVSDQGPSLVGKVFKYMWWFQGVIPLKIFGTNQGGEPFNKTLKQIIRKFVKQKAQQWHWWLEGSLDVCDKGRFPGLQRVLPI